ncbi:hypothetical protein MRX96_045948 [Rhipicephalus microplus]
MSPAEFHPVCQAVSRHTQGVLEDDSVVRREVLRLPGLRGDFRLSLTNQFLWASPREGRGSSAGQSFTAVDDRRWLRDKDEPQSMGDINCEEDDAHASIAVPREGLTCRSKQRCRWLRNPDATCVQLEGLRRYFLPLDPRRLLKSGTNPLGFLNTMTDWLRTPPQRRSSARPGECWTTERALSEFVRAGAGVPNIFTWAAADKLFAGSFG